jgi:type I restriction enzyme M protein
MLSPQLRQKVQTLWDLFWSSGISNPLAAIEQITYLLFIRQLENLDLERVRQRKRSIYSMPRDVLVPDRAKTAMFTDHAVCRWSYIKQNPSFELLNGTVFPWLRGLEDWLSKNAVSSSFSLESFMDIEGFVRELEAYNNSLARQIADRLSPGTRNSLWKQSDKPFSKQQRAAFVDDLNAIVRGESLYHPQRFEHVILRPETKQLADKNPRGDELIQLNLLLLEDAYPQFISRRQPAEDTLRQVTGRLSDAYFILDTNKTDTLARAITLIDELFRHIGTRSVNADIMGDIFEHLLEEVKESGKNGQFRTPRHVIRFMVEALDPDLGTTVLDPACGSGGFLLNTILHWKAKHTDKDVLKLEWDGTPHDVRPVWPKGVQLDLNSCFHGYDNDRTMVRIAWMNLILHDLEFPFITQLDSLSKRLKDEESSTYDHILANPPFTGNVDEGDLSTNRQRFPAGKGDKPITTKSELLFVWLILDLLKIGGRAAVIVPDGVLTAGTNAHRELRSQLLFENTLEAVISLPANMFQPYSGVKTSILIFQRAQNRESKPAAGEPPRTQEVWFYEIQDEAYTLDQKRNERYGQENDLWDALAKFFAWKKYLTGQAESSPEKSLAALRHAATSTGYWQPKYWEERWISVDDEFLKLFPEKSSDKGHTIPIHELWQEFPFKTDDQRGARQLDECVVANQHGKLRSAFVETSRQAALCFLDLKSIKASQKPMIAAAEKAARDLVTKLNRRIRDENMLDREFDQFGLNALRPILDEMKSKAAGWATNMPLPTSNEGATDPDLDAAVLQLVPVVKEFAKLDGYNVWRRTQDVTEQTGKLQPTKDGKEQRKPVVHSWIIPTRVWAKLETWGQNPETKEEITKPTHDDKGLVRADYLDWLRDNLRIFDRDGTVLEEHLERLDPDCIEYQELILSAGRYKPYTFNAAEYRPPAEIVDELNKLQNDIGQKLSHLLNLLGEK